MRGVIKINKEMELKEALERINTFNVEENAEMEDAAVTIFFDDIGDHFPKLETLSNEEKAILLQSFFDFLARQSPDLDESWSFIHFIEAIDQPHYKIYNQALLKAIQGKFSITLLFLLKRHINYLEKNELPHWVNLLKEISERNDISELVKEEVIEAKEEYENILKKLKTTTNNES